MSRTAESDRLRLEPRVLSMHAATPIALVDPASAAAAIAQEADIEVSATERADEIAVSSTGGDAPAALAISCDADLRINWGGLHRWRRRS